MKIFWVLFSSFFLLLAFGYISRVNLTLRKVLAPGLSLLAVVWILLLFAYLVADWFTGVGFDESVFYHLSVGLDGAGFGEFAGLIAAGVGLLIASLCLAVLIWRMMVKDLTNARDRSGKNVIFSVTFLLIALFINPALNNLYSYAKETVYQNDFFNYYSAPEALAHSVTPPKNLLYIYLESLERTYLDERLFPGLLPHLSALEKQAVSFSDINQVAGTSWTIAGMVASQCGLPLLSIFTNNDFAMNEFMPEATCLGDVLHGRGYQMEYIGGASSAFAGKGLFYQNHGFAQVSGKEELLDQLSDKSYLNPWGLYDDTLLDILYRRFITLSQQPRPFGLFTINLGTHHPDGQISHSCGDITYQDGKDRLLNAIHCTDILVSQFVERIRALPEAKNTLIVLASDHLGMSNASSIDKASQGVRRNLLMVINPELQPEVIDRAGSSFDIAPTLLGYLGMKTPAFALGRDLLDRAETLLEQYGTPEAFSERLLSWRPLIELFWGYPTLEQSITLKKSTSRIDVNGKPLNYPSLLVLDQNKKITGVWYNLYRRHEFTPADYLTSIPYGQTFVWVDSCAQIHSLVARLPDLPEEACYYVGSLTSLRPLVGQLTQEETRVPIEFDSDDAGSVSEAGKRRARLQKFNLVDWEEFSHQIDNLSSIPRISRLGAAGSQAVNRPSFAGGEDLSGEGLSLIRVTITRDADRGIEPFNQLITRVPLCPQDGTAVDLAALDRSVAQKKNHRTLFYGLVGNAESRCNGANIRIPAESGIKKLAGVTPGQPYIAVLDRDFNMVYERLGNKEQTIALLVNVN